MKDYLLIFLNMSRKTSFAKTTKYKTILWIVMYCYVLCIVTNIQRDFNIFYNISFNKKERNSYLYVYNIYFVNSSV